MQLHADTDLDAAIDELKLALPIAALASIIAEREKKHKPRAALRRRLNMLRAMELVGRA